MIMSIVSPLLTYRVYAETTAHSNVLDDLKRDPEFNANDFKQDDKDYNLKVLTVAEGSEGELYVYVYNPAYRNKDLKAAKINMSLQDPSYSKIDYNLYDLIWINSSGGFSKYVVNGLKAGEDYYRYYTIATVYRVHDPEIDDPANDDDDIVNFEGMPVGQSWCLYVYNGQAYCESREMQFADVEIQSVGFTQYPDGFDLYPSYCHSHFIAFSVENFNVQDVYDATIHYEAQDYVYSIINGVENEYYSEEILSKDIDISKTQNFSHIVDGLFFDKTYVLKRILKTSDFISDTEDHTNSFLSSEDASNLSKSDFVIRFLESECNITSLSSGFRKSTTYISNVTLLRLHFLSFGKVYNLGVVADIVSDDGYPDYVVKYGDAFKDGFNWVNFFLFIICILLVLNFIKDPSMALTKFISKGIWAIITLLFQILLLPFRLLAWFFK